MQSLSIFAYSESTDFSEFFDMSYILASVLWAEKHIYECCTRAYEAFCLLNIIQGSGVVVSMSCACESHY